MATIKHYRLSSDYLYTYTSNPDNIKLMLKYGLRHSLNIEKLPYKNSEQHNFIVCFCDILPEQADYHKSVYGNYAIAFKKEWGIRNKVSPLRYIHENSPGATDDYVKIKNDLREARSTLKDGNQIDYFQTLLLHSTARVKGLMTKDSIHEEVENTALFAHMDTIEKTFSDIKTKIGDTEAMNVFNEWVVPIINMLEKTVDELEKRDAYVRIYEGEFRGNPNKVLYDEREWRSVKFITEPESKANPSLYGDAIRNKFLPEEYNLKFEANDIAAIIVGNDIEKEEMKKYILAGPPRLKG